MPAIDPALLDCRQALAIVDRDGGTVGSIREFYLDCATPPDLELVSIDHLHSGLGAVLEATAPIDNAL